MSHDQAAGLRARFGRAGACLLPVIDNPGVNRANALLDALVGAYLERGLRVLVVDAGAQARPCPELALLNLAACIEALSPELGWLEARGLVAHHLDARGSAAGLLPALQAAAPQADLVLLRAPAPELARVLAGAAPARPLLLADAEPDNLMQAYAGLKWLHERAGCQVFQLLLAAAPDERLTRRMAEHLAVTAERFLGMALAGWAALPASGRSAGSDWRQLAHSSLQAQPSGRAA